MANKNLLTTYAKTQLAQLSYFAPVAVLPNSNETVYSVYAFLASVDPWPDDADPPQPIQTQKYIKNVMKNIYAVKQITAFDLSLVIYRIDWANGETYDFYRDDINILEKDQNGYPLYRFYVKNRYDQVFKCLWNNNGAPSTYEPFFEPGAYYLNNIYQNADGYKWKYLYTIDQGSKIKFMDSTWIPVQTNLLNPNPLNPNFPAGKGNIDVVCLTDGGSGYNPTESPIYITIDGDGTASNGNFGTSASAYAVVTGNTITDIVVSDTGKNYTYANVTISSSAGSGAKANVYVSPIGGHAADLTYELGASHFMYSVEFVGSENGNFPTDTTFHQIGLITNPTAEALNPPYTNNSSIANSALYSATTNLIVASGFGAYTLGEKIYQGQSVETATFVGTLVNFEVASNTLKLINTKGTPINNQPLYGSSSQTVRTLLSYNFPDYQQISGNFIYLENRSQVQRSEDGIEQIKIVLGY